mgnify:CR=1 FL=1
MEAEAFVLIPKAKENGKEVTIHVLPLIQCKDCKFRKDPKSIISEWLPCQFGRTPDNWFCASGREE